MVYHQLRKRHYTLGLGVGFMNDGKNSREVSDAVRALAYLLRGDAAFANAAANLGINRCRTKQTLTQMSFGVPTVLLPVVGTKTVIIEDSEFICKPGQLLMLPEGVSFDVENAPDRTAARYVGLGIRFDVETIKLFHQLYAKQFEIWDLTPHWRISGHAKLITAVTSWMSWMQKFPTEPMQARHRMIELLLLFAQQGCVGNLVLKQYKSWRHRLKELFLRDASKAWRMAGVCKQLGVSESTLRRHLAAESIGFRELLEEVRLEHGMGLVMESDVLISQISLACGYTSQSRFSERFKMRFSMSPTELRITRTKSHTHGNVINLKNA